MKLNIPTMRPSLSYLSEDGALRVQTESSPELHKASIRHLAVDMSGRVAIGMRRQGDVSDAVPLVALYDPASGTTLLANDSAQCGLNGHIGSIDVNWDHIAVTSPRGALLQLLGVKTMSITDTLPRPDICGIAGHCMDFVLPTGEGLFENLLTSVYLELPVAWDNHLIPVCSPLGPGFTKREIATDPLPYNISLARLFPHC